MKSVAILHLLSKKAKQWAKQHLQVESYQFADLDGHSLIIESNYLIDIIDTFIDMDFKKERDYSLSF